MANAKNSRSNKTAHVLNLLTEPGEAASEAPRAERTPAAAPAPSPDNSEEVASAIRDALEEDLLAELAEDEAPAEEPAPIEEPAEELPPVSEPAPDPEPAEAVQAEEPAPDPEPQPAAEPVQAAATEPEEEAKPAPEAAPAADTIAFEDPEPASQPDGPAENITYINVMQALVEDRVDKYMKNFNMCDCHRCRTDVIALTLTSLPAKYIVIPEHESVPMLSIYESRFGAAVTAQIIAACQKVAAHPRHANEDDGRMRLGAPRNDD